MGNFLFGARDRRKKIFDNHSLSHKYQKSGEFIEINTLLKTDGLRVIF